MAHRSYVQSHESVEDVLRTPNCVRLGLVITCHSAFYSPSSLDEIRSKSAETMRDVVSCLMCIRAIGLGRVLLGSLLQLIHGMKSNIITPEME